MKRIALQHRLRLLAEMTPPGGRLADIGTDHGYLPVWLLQEGRIPSAIAADVGAEPLEHARRTAEELFLHPLHPYTKALLSAVPIPDPSLEKHKKLLVYDPSIHDYSVDKPVWEEIANGHFVYGNQRELEGYRKEYESQL